VRGLRDVAFVGWGRIMLGFAYIPCEVSWELRAARGFGVCEDDN